MAVGENIVKMDAWCMEPSTKTSEIRPIPMWA